MHVRSRSQASRLIDTVLWAISLGLLVLSFIFSWGPPPPSPHVTWFDKVWHGFGYGVLCLTVLLAAVWRPGRGDGMFPRVGLRVAGMVLLLAWLTEALQAPFGRDVQLTDALADLAGISAGYVAWHALPHRGRLASQPARTSESHY